MGLILALDQGTTSSRAILFDASSSVVGVAQQEFQQFFPRPGWVEHDPQEIWSSQLATAREVLEKTGTALGDVEAIGITNQRETTIIWDRETGEPIHPAIVWQDRRTAGICDQLREEGHEDLIREKAGLVIDAYFSGTKVKWLLDNVEGARQRAEAGELAFGTVDTWLVWNLTGGAKHVTDVSNACRTLFFNLHTLQWDDELLDILGVPRSLLPDIVSNSEVVGTAVKEQLGAEIPIAGMAGDQQAALFGQACHDPGQAKNTYGTGSFVLMNTGEEPVISQNQLVTSVAWKLGDRVNYALEGSIFVTGAAIQWLRDQLGIISHASEVEGLAASVEDNGGVYFVPAFTGLGAPHWDPYARGAIVGLTRGSSKGHIARAALEGIAFQTVEVLLAMEKDSGIELAELRVDGGASMNALLMQIQTDLLGVPVVRPEVSETTALGAAYFAGLAVGFWIGLEEIAAKWAVDARFEPQMERCEAESMLAHWIRAVDKAKAWES